MFKLTFSNILSYGLPGSLFTILFIMLMNALFYSENNMFVIFVEHLNIFHIFVFIGASIFFGIIIDGIRHWFVDRILSKSIKKHKHTEFSRKTYKYLTKELIKNSPLLSDFETSVDFDWWLLLTAYNREAYQLFMDEFLRYHEFYANSSVALIPGLIIIPFWLLTVLGANIIQIIIVTILTAIAIALLVALARSWLIKCRVCHSLLSFLTMRNVLND